MRNYIEDTNPFRLSKPPQWWLQKLWDFDDSLVIIPSRSQNVYRLAQKRKPNIATKIVNDSLFRESDTRMLASYGLIPITSIKASVNWSDPYIFEYMRRQTPHMMGGFDKYNELVEKQEIADAAAVQAKIDDRNTQVARDGWRLYLKKIGLRSQMWSPRTKTSAQKPTFEQAPAIKVNGPSSPDPKVG